MRIVLIILAVTGILLLIILTLMLFCLFYPVSYQIKGESEDELALCGRFWWLFGLLWFEFDVRDLAPQMRFGIFGLKRSFGKEDMPQRDEGAFAPTEASSPDKKAGEKAETDNVKLPALTEEKDIRPDAVAWNKAQSTEEGGTDIRSRKRKKRIRAKTGAKPKRRFFHKKQIQLDTWKKRYLRFRAELSDEKNHMAIKHLWQEAMYIFTHLKPKYASGTICFATGDPALTGQVTGVLSLFPVMYRYDVCVCPDFASENPYIRGTVVFGGKMSLYHAVLCLIRIIRDENTIKLIQKFR